MTTIRLFAAMAAMTLLPTGLGRADEPPAKVLPAAEARDHVGETLTFEMTVMSSKNGVHRRTYFLDSAADYGDEKNLAVLIDYDHAGAFKSAGIDDPAAFYKGKRIRVTGKVIDESGQTRIRVTEPSQIKVVEEGKP